MDVKSEASFHHHFPQNDSSTSSFNRKRLSSYITVEGETTAAKITKPDDQDLVNLIRTIIDEKQNLTQEPSKVETFCNFLKSYLNTWPDRVQDEAINHITNYLVYKNIDMNGTRCSSSQTNGLTNHQN